MKKQFQSKAVPRGTRTLWRYLGALFILFTFAIGQMWGAPATSSDSKTVSGTVTFEDVTTALTAQTTYWLNGVKLYSYASGSQAASNSLWTTTVDKGKYHEDITAGSSWGSYTMSGLVMAQHAVAAHIKGAGTVTFVVNNTLKDQTKFDSNFKAYRVAASTYGTNYTSSTYKAAESGTEITSGLTFSCESGKGRYTVTYAVTDEMLDDNDEVIIKFLYGSSGTGGGKWFCYESVSFTPATPSCSTEITTQPSGATLAVGDANPELSIVATNVASYAWKESSDGTSYDGASSLGSSASFTPSVNDAVQTKYYYCEVTSSCDGAAVSKSDIVTVNVVGAISYYTVTLNPAGGTIVDAAGWALNAGNYEKEVAEGTVLTLPTFTKDNRTFKTWRNGAVDVTSPITVTADVTLTAVWNATVEQVIYSWESPDGTAVEVGGTAITKDQDGNTVEGNGNVNATLTNVTVAYKAIMLNGKISSNAWSGNYIQITTDEAVKAGDKVKVTACTTKGDTSKKGSAQMRAGSSATSTAIFTDGNSYNDILADGTLSPNTKTFTVPDGVNTSTLTMTRSQSSTNCWVTKLQIVREVLVEEANIRTVTFNYNDGVTANVTVEVASGATVSAPADPTRAHYRFHEWQLAGSAYNFATPVTGNITLTADWTQLYTISFEAGDGSGDAPAAIADKAQGETFPVPANTYTAPENKEFDKWSDGTNDYAPGDTYTVGTANVVLTAQWKALVAKYTVVFKDGETTLDTKLFDVGTNPSDAGIDKTKPLYTFAAWQKDASDIALDDASWTSVAKDAEITLTARWAVAYASDVNFKDEETQALGVATVLNTYHYASDASDISFESKGLKIKTDAARFYFNVAPGKVAEIKFGNISGATYSVDGGAAETLTSSQLKATYSASAQSCVMTMTTAAYNIVEKVTIHDPYEVSFDENGGDAPIAAMYGTPSVTLPLPTNGTESFIGWFDGETKVGEDGDKYIPTANITLKAHWEAISTDNTLSDLKVGGVTVDGFSPAVHTYYVVLPYGTAVGDIPAISATANSAKAKQVAIQQAVWAGDPYNCYRAQANVQAEDESWGYYDVRFSFAPKDGVCLVKANVGNNTITIDEEASLYTGNAYNVNVKSESSTYETLTGWKMNTKGCYVGIELDEQYSFQEGDVFEAFITTVAGDGTNKKLYVFSDHTTSDLASVLLATSGEDQKQGVNKAVLPDSPGKKVYMCRGDDGKDYVNQNPYVAYIAVYRAMNPMLKAMTINGANVVIDEEHKTATVAVPYDADLNNLTVVPNIVWNAPAASGSIIVNGGNPWVEGANTYKLTDKDGDATTYTITLSIAPHYVAQIEEQGYMTLGAAVAAANANDVVKLLDNVDLMATGLTIGTNMTLDLNGYNIKAGEELNNNINVPAGVKLTLVDNSANAEGKIYTEEAYSGAATGYGVIRVSGEFLMQSGNIYTVIESDPANLGQFAVVIAAGGKVTVEGGQIKAGWYAISNNGNNTGSTIIVSGGELISTADYAIYNPAKESTVTVSGGVVYGAAGGIAMNRGELTVTGGTITSKDQGTTGTWGDGTGGLSNAAISASGKYESVEVEISGGTIIAEGTAVMITNGTTNPVEVAISGGQFSHVVPAEYCAEGFAPVTEPNAQGKYEVEDKRIYIFNGTTSSATMATSPSGAISWAKVGDTMGEASKSGTYDEVNYVKALQLKNSSTTKHFRIDVEINNNAKIEVIGMSNDNSDTRHAWLTNSTEKGDFADAIAGLTTTGYNPEMFATDWLEEGSYYLHADDQVAIFLIRVTPKAVDPKCEQPTITAQPQTNITFGAGNLTATVEAEVTDFGTLKYQWYNAANDEAVEGATSATLTTTTEGTYYVIVTNTLANHRDNSIKSEEATLGYRVLNDATLSALSASAGTLDPEFDPAEENYTVNLAKGTTTVPTLSATATMHPYATVVINDAAEFVNYEATSTVVVTSEDGTATKTYTVHYVVAHPVAALVDVTENTTWDWSLVTQDANGAAIGSDGPTVNTEDGLVIANYLIGDNFDKIEGNNGAYSIRSSSRKVYQGASLHMHTTKGGYLSIWAANEGTSQTLNVQNAGRDFKLADLTGSQVEYTVYVKAGDVTIYNVPVTAGKPMRVSKMVFTVKETPDYTRNEMLGNGVYGTICLPNNVPAGAAFGATFYELVGREPQYGKLAFDEIVSGELEAGKPYVFQAHGDALEIFYGATHVDNPVDAGNGMYGTFVDQTLTDLDDVYYFAQRALWSCVDLTSLSIPANRAYVKLSEIDYLTDPNPAPGRIRMMMNVNGAPTVITGCENLDASETPVKVMINGQMFILRGEKMYDATGRLVK